MLPLCDLRSLCGIPDPLFPASLTQQLSFLRLRFLFRASFKDPTPLLSQESSPYEVFASTAFWYRQGGLIRDLPHPERLRFHGLITVLTLFLSRNLEILFHTSTLMRFAL